jgi:hypothetical protein
LEKLNRTADLVGAQRRFLVSQTRTISAGGNSTSCDLPWLLQKLGEEFA